MARRRNLTEHDRLNGNPHHGKAAERDLPDFGVEATGAVFIPEHLHEDAMACIEVIKSSMPPATYAKVDSFALAAFATAWALHKRLTHDVNAPDFQMTLTNGAGTLYLNPKIGGLTKQAQVMASLGDRLGLDPKSRQGLKLPSEKPKSKFDGLVGGTAQTGRAAH